MSAYTFTNLPAYLTPEALSGEYEEAEALKQELAQVDERDVQAAAFVAEVNEARTCRSESVHIGGQKFWFKAWNRDLEDSEIAANAQNYTVVGRALYWLPDIQLVKEYDATVEWKGLSQKVHCYLLRSSKGDRVATRVTQRITRKDGETFDVQRWITLEQDKRGCWVQSKSSRHYAHKAFEQGSNPFHAESIWSVAARILSGMSINIAGGNADTAVKMIQAAYKQAEEYNG